MTKLAINEQAVGNNASGSTVPGASGTTQTGSANTRGSVRTSDYIKRLQVRQEYQTLKTHVIFGLTMGWMLTLTGAFKTYILMEGGPSSVILALGIAFLAITLISPNQMAYPQNLLKTIAEFVGTNLFKGVLSLVYFLTILPAGLFYQKKNGGVPFYSWTDEKPVTIEGWADKISSDEKTKSAGSDLPSWLQPLQVVSYFILHSELVFLPCLILLLLLGLIGIFVQSSALAPFIYTLF